MDGRRWAFGKITIPAIKSSENLVLTMWWWVRDSVAESWWTSSYYLHYELLISVQSCVLWAPKAYLWVLSSSQRQNSGKFHRHDKISPNGLSLIDYAETRNMVVCRTRIQHKKTHQATWYSTNRKLAIRLEDSSLTYCIKHLSSFIKRQKRPSTKSRKFQPIFFMYGKCGTAFEAFYKSTLEKQWGFGNVGRRAGPMVMSNCRQEEKDILDCLIAKDNNAEYFLSSNKNSAHSLLDSHATADSHNFEVIDNFFYLVTSPNNNASVEIRYGITLAKRRNLRLRQSRNKNQTLQVSLRYRGLNGDMTSLI